MKKLIIIIISFLTLISIMPVSAEESKGYYDLIDNNIEFKPKVDNEIEIIPGDMEYYPFIYSNDETRKWFNERVIGEGDYREGYLYVKNMTTGVVKLLISEPVSIFRESAKDIVFIDNNAFYNVNFTGNKIEKIYASDKELKSDLLERQNDKIYFVENGTLVEFDTTNKVKTDLINNYCGEGLCIHNTDLISFRQAGKYYVLSLNTPNNVLEIKEEEYNNMFFNSIDLYSSAPTISQTDDYNLFEVQTNYPNGSYFTTDGTPCDNHDKCQSFDGGIQCVAFAKRASNTYSHMGNSWNPPTNEMYDNDTYFYSDSDIRLYFSNCAVGTYVRLTRGGDYGFHSMFLVSCTNSGIVTYNCNLQGNCGVTYNNQTLTAYRTWCVGASYYRSHSYGNTSTYYNQNYHKQKCSKCGGWRYEAHYGPLIGTNTCSGCHQTGTILYTERLRRFAGE